MSAQLSDQAREPAIPVEPEVRHQAEQHTLKVDNIVRHFGAVRAVDGISLSLKSGQIVGLIGPNGAGKSTVVNMLGGTLAINEGTVLLDGRRIDTWAPHKVAAAGVARTFQTCRLFPEMTARANVLAVERVRAAKVLLDSLLFRRTKVGASGETTGQRAQRLLELCGVGEYANTLAHALPYAVQRRVEIARALALEPHFLLLDEPAAGMNEVETDELLRLLQTVAKQGYGILLIEHHVDLVFSISHHVIVQHFGRIIAEGEPAVVREDPAVIEAYLGTRHARNA